MYHGTPLNVSKCKVVFHSVFNSIYPKSIISVFEFPQFLFKSIDSWRNLKRGFHCSLVDSYQHFEWTCCLFLLGRREN
jgi:hypothetical protein